MSTVKQEKRIATFRGQQISSDWYPVRVGFIRDRIPVRLEPKLESSNLASKILTHAQTKISDNLPLSPPPGTERAPWNVSNSGSAFSLICERSQAQALKMIVLAALHYYISISDVYTIRNMEQYLEGQC